MNCQKVNIKEPLCVTAVIHRGTHFTFAAEGFVDITGRPMVWTGPDYAYTAYANLVLTEYDDKPIETFSTEEGSLILTNGQHAGLAPESNEFEVVHEAALLLHKPWPSDNEVAMAAGDLELAIWLVNPLGERDPLFKIPVKIRGITQ